MRKKTGLILGLLFLQVVGQAQSKLDSLFVEVAKGSEDSNRVYTLARIAAALMFSSPDSSLSYAEQALKLAQDIRFKKGAAQSLSIIGNNHSIKGNYTQSFESHTQALRIYEEIGFLPGIGNTHNNLAIIHDEQGDHNKALENYLKAKGVYLRLKSKDKALYDQRSLDNNVVIILSNIGYDYEKLNQLDSALHYQKQAFVLAKQINDVSILGTILTNLANIDYKKGRLNEAFKQYKESLPHSENAEDNPTLSEAFHGIAKIYEKNQQRDSALWYAQGAHTFAKEGSHLKGEERAALLLSQLFEARRQPDSALKYFKISSQINDSISSTEIKRQLHLMNFNEQLLQQEKKAAEQQYDSNLKMYVLSSVLFTLLIVAAFLYRSNTQKRQTNLILQQQKSETEIQRTMAETALEELKVTQQQLIHAEKMASLGELTAGIAHEIQNPLNFINNFSDVNLELLEEMQREVESGNTLEALEIFKDVNNNLEKISFHGKRADNIIKNMLQHSRKSNGTKESVNINELTKEYLQLSYHGIRAKDKSFNATVETVFDQSITTVDAIPQDIGRVLLNLYNNAFYAVNEKKKLGKKDYQPTVSVTTKMLQNKVEIQIRDNGIGIPRHLVDKVFQPFFTTKPTGEGTGLGLSLSYEIITKLHNGELKVETKEGDYTLFKILLPCKASPVSLTLNT